MRGNTVLRACMLGLVLVNLVFVQLTEAASLAWLLPLYALTIFAPLLAPLRENAIYRLLWNLGVLGVFAVLVRHASGFDLRYVLQDGLVLAALCQVHLLNNLRSEQRPDLLFWNSFLIAVATGYLSQDLVYAFAFLAYVPLYIIGLQLLCVTRRQKNLEREPTRLIVRDGLRRSGALLVLTLAVFLFWPRDFHRPSFLAGEFDFKSTGDSFEIAFSDTLTLNRKGRAKVSNRVVMTATLLRGSPTNVPTLWRGATLLSTDGKGWWPLPDGDLAGGTSGDDPWFSMRGELVRSLDESTAGVLLAVENVDPEANRLFTPISAQRLSLGEGTERDQVRALPDATLVYGEPKRVRRPLTYELTLEQADSKRPGGPQEERLERGISRYTALPQSRHVREARELAEVLASRMPGDLDQYELVSSFSDYLETRYLYLAPGADGAAETLNEFLEGEAGGHCEFFASALATMLRSRGIPCRVTTGYRSSEWDSERRVLTFRRSHAHAWVEVYDPQAGWYAVDPNPVASYEDGTSVWQAIHVVWQEVHAALGKAWSVLASFDAERRDAALAWVRQLPAGTLRAARDHPGLAALSTFLLAAFLMAARWFRRRGIAPSVRLYQLAMHRQGLRLVGGETPRELLTRARADGVAEDRLEALSEATRVHERARYAA